MPKVLYPKYNILEYINIKETFWQIANILYNDMQLYRLQEYDSYIIIKLNSGKTEFNHGKKTNAFVDIGGDIDI